MPRGLSAAQFHRLYAHEDPANPEGQPADEDGEADGTRGGEVQAGERAPGTYDEGEAKEGGGQGSPAGEGRGGPSAVQRL